MVNDWINRNYNKLVGNVSRITKCEDKAMDVLHHCVMDFIQLPDSNQQQMLRDGKIENWLTKCAHLQYKSSSSPYHYQNRKVRMLEDEYIEYKHDDGDEDDYDFQLDVCLECLEREVKHLFWYNRILIEKKFLENWTYAQLHSYYGISKQSLVRDIKVGLEILKGKCILYNNK